MVTRRRGPGSGLVRYPDTRLRLLRVDRIRRMQSGLIPAVSGIEKKRLVLNLAALALFLTGLFFAVF